MQDKLYCVVGNRTVADVAARNDEVIARGLELEEAKRVAITARSGEWIAAWVEADSPSRTFNREGDAS